MDTPSGGSDPYRAPSAGAAGGGSSRRYVIPYSASNLIQAPLSALLEYSGILRPEASQSESERLIGGGLPPPEVGPVRVDESSTSATGGGGEVLIRIVGAGDQESLRVASSQLHRATLGPGGQVNSGVVVPGELTAASAERQGGDGVRDNGVGEGASPSSSVPTSDSAFGGQSADGDVNMTTGNNRDSSYQRYDIQRIAKWIEQILPFSLLLLVVFIRQHLQGFLVTIWISAVMFKSNAVLRKQTALKGQMLTLVEYFLLLYRSLLPTAVWYRFFLNKEYGSLFSSLTTGLYLTFKLTSVVEQVQSFFAALKALSRKEVHYGSYATSEQVLAAGDLCAICQEKMNVPILLRCKHIFCEDCVSEWFERERTCPLCRVLVKPAGLRIQVKMSEVDGSETINEKIHEYRGSSSSSDSDDEKPLFHNSRKKWLFGRKESVHALLGGGKCNQTVLLKILLYDWLSQSPPKFPEVFLPEDLFLSITQSLVLKILTTKPNMQVIAGLWVLSVIGSLFSFLTLFYIGFLVLYLAPVLYEKYEDRVDIVVEKAIEAINKQYQAYFGYFQFRSHQKEVIEKILDGKDCLVVMATGSGKSLCYQIPPLVTRKTAIVMSLKQRGIKAEYLGSTQTDKTVHSHAESGTYDVLYMTPEKACSLTSRFWANLLNMGICLLAVDEAHCISEWGHDFRKEYKQLNMLRGVLSDVPFVALTATATEKVRNDIICSLNMNETFIAVGSFDRQNLFYGVKSFNRSLSFVDELVQEVSKYINSAGSTIIYCTTVKDTEQIYESLQNAGIKAGIYHGQMGRSDREKTHRSFIKDELQILVATIAFGMGIDKPNVSSIMLPAILYHTISVIWTGLHQKSKKIVGNNFDNLPLHGLGKDYSATWWKALAAQLIANGYLKENLVDVYRTVSISPMGLQFLSSANTFHHRPLVLALTSEMADEEEHGNQKNKLGDLQNPAVLACEGLSEAESKLFFMLLDIRLDLANRYGTAPYAICGDETIKRLAKMRPCNKARLANIDGINQNLLQAFVPISFYTVCNSQQHVAIYASNSWKFDFLLGFGKALFVAYDECNKYGDEFLTGINKLSQELNLQTDYEGTAQTAKNIKIGASIEKRASPAKLEAWRLWQHDGLSFQKIAEIPRNSGPIKEQTVITYVLDAAREGCELNWARFCKETGLTLEIVSQIRCAITSVGSRCKLKPIKEELPESVTYDNIKTYLTMDELGLSAEEIIGCNSAYGVPNKIMESPLHVPFKSVIRNRAASSCPMKQSRSDDALDLESSASKLPKICENTEHWTGDLVATENAVLEWVRDHDGVSLLDILEHFKGSKEESVLDLLNYLEGEFVIFKKNDLYKVM
ncbi:RQC [Musa troglodytarum]|uniref:Reticulon-like protein n=1 Tax=Musa troglodytarum TaxID=320322 RepID=A0A9E7I744_9LILI|nr:RQC [Musa troglodytarum]